MKEELGTVGAVVGAVVIACLFAGLTLAIYPGWYAIGLYLPKLPELLTWPDVIAAVSAVGTCAAVVVALWLAGKQTRKTDAEALARANLYAARCAVRLRSTYEGLKNSSCATYFFNETFLSRQAKLSEKHDDFRAFKVSDFFQPDMDTLAAMIPLPNQCAHRIGRAFDILGALEKEIREAPLGQLLHKDLNAVENRLAEWTGSVMTAIDLLQVALEVCEEACDVGAPVPTLDELHGKVRF